MPSPPTYRLILERMRPRRRMVDALQHQRRRNHRHVLEHLALHLVQRLDVRIVATVQARHPLDLAHLRHLFAQQIREYAHRYLGRVAILQPIVFVKHLRQIARHAVRDQHDGLIAAGRRFVAVANLTVALQQIESGRKGYRDIGVALGFQLAHRLVEDVDVLGRRLDEGALWGAREGNIVLF